MACARLRLAAALTAAFAVAFPCAFARAAPPAPGNLHAFTLRADESVTHTFAQTPSFAWNPVSGATNYQFELATSKKFSDNALVWSGKSKSPTTALPLSLPWITGSPYSLYAHVRAVTRKGVGPWSQTFGFNMRWPTVPVPLTPSYPGLLRWSKVSGANAYMVWMLDGVNHWFTTRANMADEREYYAFHQDPSWTGTVHYRVRAMRWLYGQTDNGLPAVSYGPWSPVYTSFNPPFNPGPLTNLKTVSDVVSDAGHTATHEITPAFLWSGNTSIWGTATELTRVVVFTDEDCLNTVFNGAIVGSPAYVPRDVGPISMPSDTTGIAAARSTYLGFGTEPDSKTREGLDVKTNELDLASGTPGNNGLPPAQVVKPAKVDLWDSDWAGGHYFWTAMPVVEVPDQLISTTLAAPTAPGDTTITVANGAGITVGDTLAIGLPPAETRVVSGVAGNLVTLATALASPHGLTDPVVRPTGGVTYTDDELTQDACASGRVGMFGKTSDPTVTAQGGTPYVSGLSPDGKLMGAHKPSPRVYGQPLVSWLPLESAGQYEVQWSKKAYPWATAGAKLTDGTATTLPLAPGTWFYRVRGLDALLMGTQTALSWSDPVRVVVTRPQFRVVG